MTSERNLTPKILELGQKPNVNDFFCRNRCQLGQQRGAVSMLHPQCPGIRTNEFNERGFSGKRNGVHLKVAELYKASKTRGS
jgi:hypothetical protein